MKNKLNILFPVETINRELDFRLFLAAICVNENNRIFVGQHNVIDRLVNRMNGGIYIGKHIFKEIFPAVDISLYEKLKGKQFKFIHLDEEGAVSRGDENDWRKHLKIQLNPNYLGADDYVCSWGKFQSDFYKSREPACKENIFPTGHPRFDIYKPKYRGFFDTEVAEIKKNHGDFVLINTNISYANDGLGIEDSFSMRNNYDTNDPVRRTDHIGMWAHNWIVLAHIVELVNALSIRFPELKFILRPHPAEDWTLYNVIFKGFKNVEIIHEGPVSSWIIASRLMIHDGCTTGIEGYLSDKPVILYKSNPNEQYDSFLQNNVGVKCFDTKSVIENIESVLKGEDMNSKQALLPTVKSLMINFTEDCFENVKDVIEKAADDLQKENVKSGFNEGNFLKDEKIRRTTNAAKSFVRPLFKKKHHRYKYFRKNHFYGFDSEEISDKLERIKKLINKDFDYTIYNEDLLSIEIK